MADEWKLDASGNLILNSSGDVSTACDLWAPWYRCDDDTMASDGAGNTYAYNCPLSPGAFLVGKVTSGPLAGECLYRVPGECGVTIVPIADAAIVFLDDTVTDCDDVRCPP